MKEISFLHFLNDDVSGYKMLVLIQDNCISAADVIGNITIKIKIPFCQASISFDYVAHAHVIYLAIMWTRFCCYLLLGCFLNFSICSTAFGPPNNQLRLCRFYKNTLHTNYCSIIQFSSSLRGKLTRNPA